MKALVTILSLLLLASGIYFLLNDGIAGGFFFISGWMGLLFQVYLGKPNND